MTEGKGPVQPPCSLEISRLESLHDGKPKNYQYNTDSTKIASNKLTLLFVQDGPNQNQNSNQQNPQGWNQWGGGWGGWGPNWGNQSQGKYMF